MTDVAITLPPDVVAWIEEVATGRVVAADRKPGGARKEAWFVDVERPDGTTAELFLRYDRSNADPAVDPWTLHREAVVYLALQDTEVPVPRVFAVHPEHQAMLAERIVAENWFARIADPDERVATARHFIEQLAVLHRIDPAALDLPGFPAPTTVPALVERELDELDAILVARGGEPDPALTFTLDWLRRNIPAYEGPVVLVQGDTGPGNFLYADGRVLAIVDWELAHLGDPMDDIAWLTLRATQEELPDFPALLVEYEARSGFAIDEARVHYYQVMAEAKLQVMTHRPGGAAGRFAAGDGGAGGDGGGGGGGDVGNGLIYGMLHRRLWFEALGAALGIDAPGVEAAPDTEPGDHAWLYDALLTQMRDVVVPRIDDPLAKQRTKGFARIVKYLQQVDAHGASHDAAELADLTAMLGSAPASLRAGRLAAADAVRSRAVTDEDYLRYVWRRATRDTELMRPAMGALADRHWPALRANAS